MAENVDLGFLAKLAEQNLAEMQSLGKEVADIRTLTLQNVDYLRRVERRMTELRDDIEVTIKSELLGSMTHLEGRIETAMTALSERVSSLEHRLSS